MNILFLSISSLPHISKHSISLDLIHEFLKHGHSVYAVAALERGDARKTSVSTEAGCTVLRVKIGRNKKANLIEKGLTTISLPMVYKAAVQKHFADVKFDLVLYPTPPVTHAGTVQYIKKRDGAKSYLLLKDIFPQNAVDLGMMSKSGPKSAIYYYFRNKEKQLYALSDRIGCMSPANCDYVLRNNPSIDPTIVEVCPNSIEVRNMSVSEAERREMREKYAIPENKRVFVYGGNLGKPQGIPFLIECMRAQKGREDAYFLIVGDGTEYKKLEAYIAQEHPTNVRLMSKLPKEDYDRLVAACDAGLIFLDHRFTIPNFPSRLLSYMQAELPVLVCSDPNTDIGKIAHEGGFGWWCESNDVEAFVSMVDKAMQADLPAMGKIAYRYLEENYTVERNYETIMKLFE